MAENSAIEWTETGGLSMATVKVFDTTWEPSSLGKPLSWKKPRRIFVNSMSDLFHEDVPDAFIVEVFATMYEAQWHTFQILTKRAERMASLLANPRFPWAVGVRVYARLCPAKKEVLTQDDLIRDVMDCWPLRQTWLGVSVEDKKRLSRLDDLMKTPAAIRFVSMEPLLEDPGDLSPWLNIRWQCSGCKNYFSGAYQKVCPQCGKSEYWSGSHAFNGRHRQPDGVFPPQTGSGIDWCIVGGESGHDARSCDIAWIRSLIQQCKAAGVACFVKQLGSRAISTLPDFERWPGHHGPTSKVQFSGDGFGNYFVSGLRDKKGSDSAEWPEDLRVREFPEPRS